MIPCGVSIPGNYDLIPQEIDKIVAYPNKQEKHNLQPFTGIHFYYYVQTFGEIFSIFNLGYIK